MKIATILGTRPEIIRLSRVIPALDGHCTQIVVHTGQNDDPILRDVFFDGLGVRQPDTHMGIHERSFGSQVGRILAETERVLETERPDRVLILGDTNSALAAIVACRMGIPVFHVEAGNRCYDDRVPEEVNRRLVDHASAVLLAYTERSRMNLLREGIHNARIFVVGNPIFEVLEAQRGAIDASDVHARLGLRRGEYMMATTHRQENVDVEPRLRALADSLAALSERHGMPVLWNLHPRTRSRLEAFGIEVPSGVVPREPFAFHDFVALEAGARCVLSDSGTVQEECAILRIPAVTLRDVTERPETLDFGTNMLAGVHREEVLRAVGVVLAHEPEWQAPPEYLRTNVSDTIARIVLGHHEGMRPAA